MYIVTEKRALQSALRQLKDCLKSFGKPKQCRWKFPGAGGQSTIPTWSSETPQGHLTIGFSPGGWTNKSPVLVSLEPPSDGLSPVVELNIPLHRNRSINGCFVESNDGRLWLCHRGVALTATPFRLGKAKIHQYFQKWLVTADDGVAGSSSVIPVAIVEPTEFAGGVLRFASTVFDLKQNLAMTAGDVGAIKSIQGWREDIRFPEKISKITAENSSSYEYRHGPVQQLLQQYLRERLTGDCKVVLNSRIDLGILRNESLSAIFEVKTGLGSQLYSGIGQLLVYRRLLARDQEIPLFLVIPSSAATDDELFEARALIQALGLTLVIQEGATFQVEDKKDLCNAFDPKWLVSARSRP
jgi:hypothetical protein